MACLEHALAVQQCRAAHGYWVFTHQLVGFGTGPVCITKIDGGIKLGVREEKGPCAVGQVDGDFRMLLLEILEAW
ncbi:hypothetical protein D9M68_989600 [compost metagenome]